MMKHNESLHNMLAMNSVSLIDRQKGRDNQMVGLAVYFWQEDKHDSLV